MQELNLKFTDLLMLIPLALLLYVTHIPGFDYMRVDGPVLVVTLFAIYRPGGLPLFLAFSIGLLQDIVALAPLGQHALGLVVIAYVTQSLGDRMRMQNLWKQLPSIFVFFLMVKFIHSWVVALGFSQLPTVDSVISVVVTTVLWPPFVRISYILIRDRRDRVMGLN